MLDNLLGILWAVTYVLIIIAGVQSWNIKKASMPYIACILNFSWEICALISSGGLWVHILWLSLDFGIVFLNFRFLISKKKQAIYVLALICAIVMHIVAFLFPNGMLISSFVIDLIMAICFCVDAKKLSPKLKTSIAATKFLGDLFAGIYYGKQLIVIAIIAVFVGVLNFIYLNLCLEQQYHQKNGVDKKKRNKPKRS